jgi:hypothetical protein
MSVEMERHYISVAKKSLESTMGELYRVKLTVFKFRKDLEKQTFVRDHCFPGGVREPDYMTEYIEKMIRKYTEKIYILEAEVLYWQHVLEKV